MSEKIRRCARCDRRLRKTGDDWVCVIDDVDDRGYGVVKEVVCPGCATGEEHIEREINDALVDYIWSGNRVAMWPKLV